MTTTPSTVNEGAPTVVEEKVDSSAPALADRSRNAEAGLTDQTNYLPRRKIISVFLACAAVETVGLLDETMVSVAMPTISTELQAGSQIGWIATAYFVTNTACQLLYGRLSDIWSRKTVLFALMFVFFVGNLGAAFAQTFVQLLVFRAITGMAGGGLPTIAQVIVSDVVSLRQRGKYQGILGIAVAFSHGVGPLLGGAFAQYSTWRWIFRMSLPSLAVSAVLVYFFMPLKKVEGNWKRKLAAIDYLGALLVLAGSTLVVLALSWVGVSYPWDSVHVLTTLIIGIFLLIGFVLWQWRGAKLPLLPLHIFREPVVIGAAITQFVNGFLTMVQVFFLPTFYQTAYGYSAVKSGLMLLPLTVIQTFTSTLSGLIITWTGRYRELILSGWAMWSIGLGLLATLHRDSTVAQQIGYSILTGVGVGQTFQPSLVAIQGALERKDMAIVTTMRSFVRNIGASLGLAITGTIVNNVLSDYLKNLNIDDDLRRTIIDNPVHSRELEPELYAEVITGYRRGFRIVFVMLASLAVLSFITAFFLMKHRSLDRDDDAQLKREGKQFIEDMKNKKRQKRDGEGGSSTAPATQVASPLANNPSSDTKE
ncbi:hypothetical protein AX16_009265 [Volvariella volvacea WC 439]|nr:hypothetical protein AX16_009265 [Volvariella volvacea WC 439]